MFAKRSKILDKFVISVLETTLDNANVKPTGMNNTRSITSLAFSDPNLKIIGMLILS